MKEQSKRNKIERSVRYISAGGHAMPIYETKELLNNEKDKNGSLNCFEDVLEEVSVVVALAYCC